MPNDELINKHIAQKFNKFSGERVNPADPEDHILKKMRTEAALHYRELYLVPEGSDPSYISTYKRAPLVVAELVNAGHGAWEIGNKFYGG